MRKSIMGPEPFSNHSCICCDLCLYPTCFLCSKGSGLNLIDFLVVIALIETNWRSFNVEDKVSEDFNLWEARSEATLEENKVFCVVLDDFIGDGKKNLSGVDQLAIVKSRGTIMPVQGYKPIKLLLSLKRNPFKMLEKFKNGYAVTNLAAKVQLKSQLVKLAYDSQNMQEYISSFKEVFNSLSAMGSPMDFDMQVIMSLA